MNTPSLFHSFHNYVRYNGEIFPDWRDGQTAFNTLRTLYPELAKEIRGTELDPFYKVDLYDFYAWLEKRLEQMA